MDRTTEGRLTPHDVRRALAGDHEALTLLVESLTPVIQARAARSLLQWRRGSSSGRDVHQEVEDLTQEVFLVLFADGGKVLKKWDPELGLSLLNFVGLVAERQTVSICRSGKKSPWKEDPTLDDVLDGEWSGSGPEEVTATREELRWIVDRLTEELSPLGRHLFDLLFLHDLPVPDVMRQTGMKSDAVYAWRSRLRRLAFQLRRELSETAPRARTAFSDGLV